MKSRKVKGVSRNVCLGSNVIRVGPLHITILVQTETENCMMSRMAIAVTSGNINIPMTQHIEIF